MSSVFTVYPGYRDYTFFNGHNVALISNILTETLAKEFKQKVIITDESIMRTMQQIFEERYETIPEMNRRVLIELLRDFRNQMFATEKANYLLNNKWEAYNYDPVLGIKPYETPKLNQRYRPLKFAFTF